MFPVNIKTVKTNYRTHAIVTHGLYIFYPLFEVHLCTVTFGLMYGFYSRAASNQEQPMMARVRYPMKKVFEGFHNIFHVYLMRGFQKYARN